MPLINKALVEYDATHSQSASRSNFTDIPDNLHPSSSSLPYQQLPPALPLNSPAASEIAAVPLTVKVMDTMKHLLGTTS